MPHRIEPNAASSSSRLNSYSASNTKTASTAPMGSTMMPSHRAMGPVRPAGRTCRRIGPMTVGPVTVSSAPSNSEIRHDSPTM